MHKLNVNSILKNSMPLYKKNVLNESEELMLIEKELNN